METLVNVAWPIVVLILGETFIFVFRKPIANLIGRTRSAEGEGGKWKVNFDPEVDSIVSKPLHQIIKPASISSEEKVYEPTIKSDESRLSKEEIENSKRKAQKRLDEDTKKVGYQRGELYQLTDGSYGIKWSLNLSDKIIVSDSTKSDSGKSET